MKLLLLAAAAAAAAPSEHPPAQASSHAMHRMTAMVNAGAVDDDGTIWFATWHDGVRFILDAKLAGQKDSLWQVLIKSHEDSRSVDVTFDAAAVRANERTGTIDFPICTVRFEELVFTSQRRCADTSIEARAVAKSALLAAAVGWSETQDGSATRGRDLLDHALSSNALTPAMQIVALRARAQANEEIAFSEAPGSGSGDRALVAALVDHRRLTALKPDDVEFRFDEAFDLVMLGDYPAAITVHDSILKQWPDETYRVTIGRAAIARLQGDNQRALDLLNGLFAQSDSDLGMKFYYHRGWTLGRLGRFDEAIADFTLGMKSQGDYAWAYMRRGCAHAALGRPGFAIADLDAAIGLMEKLPDAHGAQVQHDLGIAKQAVAKLKPAVSSSSDAPAPGLCDGFWGDQGRKRSALLDSK